MVNNDTLALKIYYYVCAVLGVLPCSALNGRFYCQFYLLIFSVVMEFYAISKMEVMEIDFVAVLDVALVALFNGVNIYHLICYNGIWDRFSVLEFDTVIGRVYISKLSNFKSCFCTVLLLLLTMSTYFGMMIFDEFLLSRIITNCQIIAIIAFISEISKRLSKELKFFRKLIIVFCKNQPFHRTKRNRELKKLENIYRNIYFDVVNVNTLFGNSIFVIILFSSFKILVMAELSLHIVPIQRITIQLVSFYLYATIFLVMVAMLVIAGDKIENCGIKTVKLFYVLQTHMHDPLIEHEIKDFANVLENLRPVLTVAGYVNLNRKLFPILLSNVTTYVIILIQLNTTN